MNNSGFVGFKLVKNVDNEPRVDSRNLCQRLGINHNDFMNNVIYKYQERIFRFGQLRFQNDAVVNSVGAVNQQKYISLNEGQVTFIATLIKNTEEALDLKELLTIEFLQMKEFIRSQTNDMASKARAMNLYNARALANEPRVKKGWFSVIGESQRLCIKFSTAGYQLPDYNMDGSEMRIDVSLGRAFSDFLKNNHPEKADTHDFYSHLSDALTKFSQIHYIMISLPQLPF